MKGQTNSNGSSFKAKLIGEITKEDKSEDNYFLQCTGQTVSSMTYNQLAKYFSISTFGSKGFNAVQGMTTGYNIRSVVYWKNMYYAFSTTSPAIFTSTDGYYWTKNTEETDLYYAQILAPYGDMLLAIGSYTYTSTDGKIFVERESLGNEFSYYAIKNNRIIIGSNIRGTALWYSDDGINWIQENSIPGSGMYGVYGMASNDNIYAIAKDTFLWTSKNGISWVNRFILQDWGTVMWFPDLNEFRGAIQGSARTFYGLSDGTDWNSSTVYLPFEPTSANNLFIVNFKNYFMIFDGSGRKIAINQYWDDDSSHQWQQKTWNINSYAYGDCVYADNNVLLYGTQTSGNWVALNILRDYNFILPNYTEAYYIKAIGGGNNIVVFFYLYLIFFINYFYKKEVRIR